MSDLPVITMQHQQAMSHIDEPSPRPGGDVIMSDEHGEEQNKYVKLNEVTLPDGKTKLSFFAHKLDAPTLDEVMNDVLELASESLVRRFYK